MGGASAETGPERTDAPASEQHEIFTILQLRRAFRGVDHSLLFVFGPGLVEDRRQSEIFDLLNYKFGKLALRGRSISGFE